MRKKFTALLLGCALAFGLFTGPATGETNWPTRPVQLVVPFPPGGDTDFYARTYAPLLEELLGQPFTIINIAGASGTVGATQVSMAAPDGYTVLFYHSGTMFVNNLVGATELNHHDFAMSNIAVFCDATVLVAGVQAGFTDAADFIARARANPRRYSVATTMPGFTFFVTRRMEIAGDFQVNAVDVGGAGPMIASVLGGHTELAAAPYAIMRQYIESGDMIALMVSAEERNPNFPDVPTVEEMGLTGAAIGRAYFFAFPLGTDEAILRRLSDAVGEIQQNPELVESMRQAFAIEPFFLPTEETMAFLDEKWESMATYRDRILEN